MQSVAVEMVVVIKTHKVLHSRPTKYRLRKYSLINKSLVSEPGKLKLTFSRSYHRVCVILSIPVIAFENCRFEAAKKN